MNLVVCDVVMWGQISTWNIRKKGSGLKFKSQILYIKAGRKEKK